MMPGDDGRSHAPFRLAVPHAAPGPSAASGPAGGLAARPRLLVLEDNPESRLLLGHLLRNDWAVVMTANVEEALAAAREGRPDVALLDINLGEERTGVDVLRMIHELPGYESIPAVACTAYALPGDRERFLQAGFVSYVSKPFMKAKLLEALRGALDGQASGA